MNTFYAELDFAIDRRDHFRRKGTRYIYDYRYWRNEVWQLRQMIKDREAELKRRAA